MPYVKKEQRKRMIDNCEVVGKDAGELNYTITNMLLDYVELKGESYQTINDIIGALEGAKLEFYRRFATPYEDKKIVENGDVYKNVPEVSGGCSTSNYCADCNCGKKQAAEANK